MNVATKILSGICLLLLCSVIFPTSISGRESPTSPEETKPGENTGGLVPMEPVHMVLDNGAEVNGGEPVGEPAPLSPGWQTIMSENFEGSFPTGLWVAFDNDGSVNGEYYWDDDDYKPHSGSWSAWCANGGANGLDPQLHYYPNNMASWMTYGPFDLSDATDAELNFHYWLQSEENYDYFLWLASTDSIDFYGWQISGDTGGWASESFDLTTAPTLGNLCGEPEVWVAFIFESDGSVFYDGAFVDDVVLQRYVPSAQFDLEAVEVYLSTQADDAAKEYVVSEPAVGQEVYFHFKWNCLGSGTTPSFRTELKLDGTVSDYGEGTAEGGINYTSWSDIPWTATAGAHNLTSALDVDDDIAESDETNNEANRSWESALPEAAWTFMVYSDGDNNLEEGEIASFNHMELSANNANVNVIVQLDRIPGYDSSNGDWTTTRRYELKYDTDINNFASYAENVDYWDLGELNMADPNTLTDFVSWAKSNYPADHYCLVVSNHGAGWQPKGIGQPVPKGIVWDDTSGDYMSTAGMGDALNSITSGGTEKLDVLFLDACLMQMIEVGYEVKDYSQYLVASQYYGWGSTPGWSPYDDYVASISAITSPEEMAITVVNEYHNDLTGSMYAHTMSAVDLSQYGLASAVDDFALALLTGLSTYRTEIESSRDACQKFGTDYYGVDSYLDLYHFAYLIDQSIGDATIQTAAQAVMTAVNNAVIAEAHENGSGGEYYELDNAHGVAIYFPASESDPGYSDYSGTNLQFVADKSWDEFLHSYFGIPTVIVTSPDGDENWIVGSNQTITWISSGITGDVHIGISRDGGSSWSDFITNTANDGSESWTVTGPTTIQARIRITSASDGSVWDMSDGNFVISSGAAAADPVRILPDSVWAGGEFQVTVNFTSPADNSNAIGLTDLCPAGWTLSVDKTWCTPGADVENHPTPDQVEYIWFGPYASGAGFTAVYNVQVPGDAMPGTYNFTGGTLDYYIGGEGPYTEAITGDYEVEVGVAKIVGQTREVNSAILAGVNVTLYQGAVAVMSTISDGSGNYTLMLPELGSYNVTASKDGYRSETQAILVTEAMTYTLDFAGNHGLIPDAPDMPYVLASINLWKFGTPPYNLNISMVLAVINAWKNPIA